MTIPAIIVHGGAGAWNLRGQRLQHGREACAQAAAAGQALLADGGSALDAVEAAVRILEDSPVLDAGRGSYPNAHGAIEMDALLMDGRTLNLGAVAAVQRIRYPISLARRILDEPEFNFLVGPGAEFYADSVGFPRCEAADLHVELDAELPEEGPAGDTVGAVALDKEGNLAAATSTGGTRQKRPGRVGDSPLVGSGAYADNHTAAVSATGRGEDLMKILISRQVCDYVAAGRTAQEACDAAIRLLAVRVSGQGGLIAIDALGRIGFAYNTYAMPYAYANGSGAVNQGQ